jgi:type II secretory pathway pseudopilin PulG
VISDSQPAISGLGQTTDLPARRLLHRRAALSLVEVLFSISILSILLTATGAAFVAATKAVQINDHIAVSMQSARVSLNQMLTQIRRCQALQVAPDHIDLITFDNHKYTYQFDAVGKQLLLVNNDTATPVTNVLSRNVVAATFAADMAPEPETQALVAVHVAINLTVGLKDTAITVNGSGAPRVNIHY